MENLSILVGGSRRALIPTAAEPGMPGIHRSKVRPVPAWIGPLLTVTVLAFAPLASNVFGADTGGKTKGLIAVLQSDAGFFEKARACQQLGEIGSAEAVPALSALLSDPHLNAYARSGLEGIPDPRAAAVLRDAAGKLKGPLLVGVVNSLGVLRDGQAVGLLSRLAADPASGCAREALLALGNIATPEAILILQRMLAGQSDLSRETAASASLLAADRQRANGGVSLALHLYDLIRTAKVSLACQVGATRGAILARTADQVPFVLEQLRSPEPAIRNAALLTIREVPSDSLASALNQEATRVTAERQRLILMAMADCHNAQSLLVIENLANSPAGEIRRTAWAVLGRIGPEAAPVLLAALRKEPPADEKSLILAGLRGAEGSGVDELLVRALAGPGSPAIRVELIRLLEERGVKKAAGQLLALAGEPERSVSLAALSSLRSLADQQQLPGVMALARSGGDQEIRDAAATALAGLCGRAGEPAAQTVLRALEQSTQPAERMVWVDVLAGIGYAKALPVLEAAARDPDPALAHQALVQLGRWPNPAPMETLLKATETGATPALRNAALGSALELAGAAADDAAQPPEAVVPWLRRINSCAQSVADQRRILGVLGRLKTAESFRLAASYLDRPELATEAASAVVQIAPALLSGADAAELKPALQKIGATVTNADLRRRALELSKPRPPAAPAVSLFDGVSLAGWEGDAKVWRVRAGLIVGGSLQGNPRNEFLASTRSYTNFFLRLEYKLVGTQGFINSGVQFRSVRVANPPNEMNGYQADIGAGHSGCLYDESRRNTFLARCSDDTIKRLEKPGDWNRYELRCEGTHIQIWLNGEKTIDYAEPDPGIPQSGLIGLQIHGGNKAEVSFRNITLQEL